MSDKEEKSEQNKENGTGETSEEAAGTPVAPTSQTMSLSISLQEMQNMKAMMEKVMEALAVAEKINSAFPRTTTDGENGKQEEKVQKKDSIGSPKTPVDIHQPSCSKEAIYVPSSGSEPDRAPVLKKQTTTNKYFFRPPYNVASSSDDELPDVPITYKANRGKPTRKGVVDTEESDSSDFVPKKSYDMRKRRKQLTLTSEKGKQKMTKQESMLKELKHCFSSMTSKRKGLAYPSIQQQ